MLIIDKITKKEIGLKNPIFKSFLSKCYFTFNNNEKLQKSIKKIVNIKALDLLNQKLANIYKGKKDAQLALEKKKEEKRLADEEKRLAKEKEKEERRKKIPIINKYIERLVDEFNKCCDELIDNCDNGVLSEYKYISNVINSIIIIIYTKYLHLPYYFEELYMNYSFLIFHLITFYF